MDLRLQASTPSSQLCSVFPLLVAPQFLYQAPPGAQQLTRPDFLNVPQSGHFLIAKATPGTVVDIVIGVLAIRHCASHRCEDDLRQGYRGIDPDEPKNMSFLLAIE